MKISIQDIVIVCINVIAFIHYGIDKFKAIKNKWRIPEARLLLFMGIAPIGSLLGMMTFRHKIRKKRFIILGSIMLTLHACIYLWIQCNVIKVNKVTIDSDNLSKGTKIRIVQLSDVHAMEFGKDNMGLIHKVDKQLPDLVVITGDLISHNTESFASTKALIQGLIDKNYPIYYVTGNHEYDNLTAFTLIQWMRLKGVVYLKNSHEILTLYNQRLNICGIDDAFTGHADLEKALHGVDTSYFTLLLSHAPKIVKEKAIENVDLVLSGHTHAGQVRLPIIGPIISHNGNLFPTLFHKENYIEKGVYEITHRTKLYIDSGLGTSHYKIRLFNQSQLSLIEINGVGNKNSID